MLSAVLVQVAMFVPEPTLRPCIVMLIWMLAFPHTVTDEQVYFYYSKVMFTLLSTVPELYCAYCASVYFISFSHGYSAILAAKLMIKLDLTAGEDGAAYPSFHACICDI